MNEKTMPTVFDISMDYLPIQASAVPCERAFSSSAETDTLRRNRIHPVLMEALQMLKFSVKKQRSKGLFNERDLQCPEDASEILCLFLGGDGSMETMNKLFKILAGDD
jgi:hypothetical protein